jgi:hypothetical protein
MSTLFEPDTSRHHHGQILTSSAYRVPVHASLAAPRTRSMTAARASGYRLRHPSHSYSLARPSSFATSSWRCLHRPSREKCDYRIMASQVQSNGPWSTCAAGEPRAIPLPPTSIMICFYTPFCPNTRHFIDTRHFVSGSASSRRAVGTMNVSTLSAPSARQIALTA